VRTHHYINGLFSGLIIQVMVMAFIYESSKIKRDVGMWVAVACILLFACMVVIEYRAAKADDLAQEKMREEFQDE
jgi:hypothetical protein